MVRGVVTGAPFDGIGWLPEPTLRVLGAGFAEALDAIHAVGLIHRDLKPSNVLLADDGPRVIDFGIARALDGTAITRTQVVIGTPGYMAPEQIAGGEVGPACDVFSLGHVLCHAAGCAPFGHGEVQVMFYRVMHAEPDLSAVPESLRPVIAACLGRDPADRPTPARLLEWFGPPAHGASAGAWLPARLRAAPPGVGAVGDAGSFDPGPTDSVPPSVGRPDDRTFTAVTEPGETLGPPRPVAGKRRSIWLLAPLVLVLIAAAVCVPLYVLNHDGSTPPSCFPPGTSADGSKGGGLTGVPVGTPHPPDPAEPANRTAIELGQSIRLSWDHVGARSVVTTMLGDDTPRYSASLTTATCTFTPTATGLYRWEVCTSAREGQPCSGWSEDRFLFVRPKGSSTPNPARDVPDAPRPVAPADQTVVKAGQPVTLSWASSGFNSQVHVVLSGGKWQHMPWQEASTYTYTPPSPGIYTWVVSTAAKGGCDGGTCVSGASAQRYLIVE